MICLGIPDDIQRFQSAESLMAAALHPTLEDHLREEYHFSASLVKLPHVYRDKSTAESMFSHLFSVNLRLPRRHEQGQIAGYMMLCSLQWIKDIRMVSFLESF